MRRRVTQHLQFVRLEPANVTSRAALVQAACFQLLPGPMRAIPIPAEIADRILVALTETMGVDLALVMMVDEKPVLALVRGDHTLSETKFEGVTGGVEIRPAHPEEMKQWFGADAGSLRGRLARVLPGYMVPRWILRRSSLPRLASGKIDRRRLEREIPEERFDLVIPHSTCPSCGAAIRAWQNIPVISYLFLGGRCANCKESISARYPVVELMTGVLAGICAWHFGFGKFFTGGLIVILAGLFDMLDGRVARISPDAVTDPDNPAASHYLIDVDLRRAGWPLDKPRDREYEVSGMPNDQEVGYVDYVLWGDDGRPLGLVEAKKTTVGPAVGQQRDPRHLLDRLAAAPDGLCDQIHAADRTGAFLVAHDLRMHRADIFRVEVLLCMFQRAVVAGLGQRLARRVRGRLIGSEAAAQQAGEDRDGQQCRYRKRHGRHQFFAGVHFLIQLTRFSTSRTHARAARRTTAMAGSAGGDRRAVQAVAG